MASLISTTSRSWAVTLAAAIAAMAACVPTPDDRTARFEGPIDPCRVELLGGAPPAPPSARAGDLWEPGPYPVWNTHPGPGCNDNPRVPIAATRTVTAVTGDEAPLEYRNLQLYVTYPAQTDPSFTGLADVARGPFGVIVFAHANNDSVCEIFESYYSLHDHWASWGWIVASADGTPFNCDRGSRENIELRAQGMVAAVDLLRELNDDPDSRFHQRLDLERIVLAGHSRGGGAAFIAARELEHTLGVITLQGIDLAAFGFGTGTATRLPTLGVTAGNDVDLHYPRVEPMEDRLGGPYAWVNINGGTHAYTADTVPDEFDDRPGLSRANQHDLTELFTTAFLLDLVEDPRGAPVVYGLDGAAFAREVAGNGVYHRWHDGRDALWIDRFDREDPVTNDLGGPITADGFERHSETYTYRPETDDAASIHGRWSTATSLLLSSIGAASYETRLDVAGPRDVAQTPVLTFRIKGPDFGAVAPLTVVFEHENGDYPVPVTQTHRGPLPLANRFQQVVVPVPLPHVRLRAIRLEITGGTVMIDDLRLTPPP